MASKKNDRIKIKFERERNNSLRSLCKAVMSAKLTTQNII